MWILSISGRAAVDSPSDSPPCGCALHKEHRFQDASNQPVHSRKKKKKAVNNRYKACASRQDCISVKEIGFERSLPEGGTISSASSRVN
jgi:hypothetical protein